MKEVTAIKVIQKDAEFLGMGFLSMMKFIETNPLLLINILVVTHAVPSVPV